MLPIKREACPSIGTFHLTGRWRKGGSGRAGSVRVQDNVSQCWAVRSSVLGLVKTGIVRAKEIAKSAKSTLEEGCRCLAPATPEEGNRKATHNVHSLASGQCLPRPLDRSNPDCGSSSSSPAASQERHQDRDRTTRSHIDRGSWPTVRIVVDQVRSKTQQLPFTNVKLLLWHVANCFNLRPSIHLPIYLPTVLSDPI